MLVVGTRPEIIKMSPIIRELSERKIPFHLVHSGQHYDLEMSKQFFEELEIPEPNDKLGIGSGTHAQQTAAVSQGIERIISEENPDVVFVQGDTNTCFATALTSIKIGVPVAHIEAGLRSYDRTMPEEINRVLTDNCSELFFAQSEQAAINLLSEGFEPHKIFVVGNTIVDACLQNLRIAEKKYGKKIGEYAILTLHRQENVDNKERVSNIGSAVTSLGLPIIFPVHPRTLERLKKFGLLKNLEESKGITLTKPMGYLEFLLMLKNARLVLTDSGGIQEECCILGVPCFTLRDNTERPETIEAGCNILVGANPRKIVDTVKKLLADLEFEQKMRDSENPYGDGTAAKRVVDITLNAYEKGDLKVASSSFLDTGYPRISAFRVGALNGRKIEEIEAKDVKVLFVFDEYGNVFYPSKTHVLKRECVIQVRGEKDKIDKLVGLSMIGEV